MAVMNPPVEQAADEAAAAPQVSLEAYLERHAAHFCEWVEGEVIPMSPISLDHISATDYLSLLLRIYFTFRPIGRVIPAPFVMRLPAFPNRRREPDLQIILKDNPGTLTETYMDGPADICIEVVSAESVARDHGDKFEEYEKGGVREYWIVDPIRSEGRFYRRSDEGIFLRQTEDAEGFYRTPLLPGFALHVPTLWQDALPDPIRTVEAVKALLNEP
ncbi:MAG: Uma2 family endonuclease [Chloroflexi bacterium]|nr:Uma2 family endonuclease [Chloroflexota bacterium]